MHPAKRSLCQLLMGTVITATAQVALAQPASEYLLRVQQYADAMIEHGRDTYGTEHSPLFASALDRQTFKPLGKTIDEVGSIKGFRQSNRVVNGANVAVDRDFYFTLYKLTEITGDPRYAAEADAALQWFHDNAQSSKGFFAWGEHLGWDFYTEGPSRPSPNEIHEIYNRWTLWDRSYQLAPDAMNDYAIGLWNHQIANHTTGNFSRHAHDAFDPTKGSARTNDEFPRHGGYYIDIWARSYAVTGDAELLTAIEAVHNGFVNRSHPVTGLIPASTREGELVWPHSNVELASGLWNAAALVPAELGDKLRATALKIDQTFLAIPHDPATSGFVNRAVLSTGQPEAIDPDVVDEERGSVFSNTWAAGYGVQTHASVALKLYERYQQVPNDGYRQLILAAADRYLQEGDPPTDLTFPKIFADLIALDLAAYELTGDQKYLEHADTYAGMAVDLFFDDSSPLPKARYRSSNASEYYDTITGAPELSLQLLELWSVQNLPEPAGAALYGLAAVILIRRRRTVS